MKKLLLAFGLLAAVTAFSKHSPVLSTNHCGLTTYDLPLTTESLPSQYVYIDADPKEPHYHTKEDCEYIKKGHKMTKVTLSEAVNKYHLKPCPYCAKPKK